MSELVRRQIATTKTLEKFRDVPFSWKNGVHCAALAKYHLRMMQRRSPTLPRIRSEFAAVRALKTRGWDNVADMLNEVLKTPIAPAEMLMGDICVLTSEHGVGAVFICAGTGKIFGWREDQPNLVMLDVSLDELNGAWRV